MAHTSRPVLLAVAALAALPARAAGVEAGGYFRVMARPDLQGGDGRLGYWNLYGRLMNEGPYAALETRWDVLEPQAGSGDVWTSLHARVEGGSILNADGSNGSFTAFRLSQVYARAGNVLLRDVTWQVGTLDTWFGSLGLYDIWPARIFYETAGLSGRWRTDHVDLLLGLGDSGWALRGEAYDPILTPGGTLRVMLGDHLEAGLGGEYRYERAVEGNRNAPYQTPGVTVEDWLRGEVVERWAEDHPEGLDWFPDPEPRDATSWKAIGYLGFGGLGPLRWNNLFASWQRLHPEGPVTETWDGADYSIWIADLTDERYELQVGDEAQVTLVPHRLEAVLAGLWGDCTDRDNDVAPSDRDRTYASTVLRLQWYATGTFHLLAEGSAARERSRNGNAYREHWDSIFASTGGAADVEGLEYGDADTRYTWQGKAGFVVNPLGPGVFTRPSLRLLYGFQYSSQQNAFGNAFVETLDQFNEFETHEDRHWHHLLALETEAWF